MTIQSNPPDGGLIASSISKRFGGVTALSDVSVDVRFGEIVGLVGPNGAGKSTLVDILTGLTREDSGVIRFGSSDITRQRAPKRAELGLARTYQVVRPLRDLTVLENVMVGALFGRRQVQSVNEARVVAADSLDRVGLSHRASAECRDISTGETKKMDLARAMAMDPVALLLDEPLAGVGHREAAQLIEVIVGMASQGAAVLLVEHVMRAVWNVSHRVAVLDYGRLIAFGPPAEVAADPAVIAAYLGDRYAAEGVGND